MENDKPIEFRFKLTRKVGTDFTQVYGNCTKYGTDNAGFIFKLPKHIGEDLKIANNEPQTFNVAIIMNNKEVSSKTVLYTLNQEYFMKVTDSQAVKKILTFL